MTLIFLFCVTRFPELSALRKVRDSKITKDAYMLPISGKDDYGM